MLAIGILAILSVGLAGMMSSGDSPEIDDQDTPQEIPETEPEIDLIEASAPDLGDGIVPADSSDSVTPDADAPDQPEDSTLDTESVYQAPPSDPMPAPRITDPVTVFMADGSEVPDETVLSEGPSSGENSDRNFIVTAPEGENLIAVEYEQDTTYAITYNEDTTRVAAALNSNISGPEGIETREVIEKVDAAGTPFTETLITREFESAPSIVLHIDQSYVGEHVAEIDLTNPNATLDFYFTRMESGVHLVYDEVDTSEGDSFITTRTLYIIETPLGMQEVSEDAQANIIANGFDPENEARLIAEVDLGYSELTSQSNNSYSGPFLQSISNFINEEPNISTNFFWMTNNAVEELEEDETGPNVWLGVPDDQVGTAPNTGLVLEPGVTFVPATGGGDTPDTSQPDNTATPDPQPTDGMTPAERAQFELDRANALLDLANANLSGLGV
ncbi:hypothetical protein [uncultured Sulfitobacter sp.]|uniref:hypothetical protein n=1 Tax=uncultured Sulfitobacter sp. TaxID=191468 RepID=UPI0026233D5A|nr:hypothetical protein [uncultured Sulfitobacter sp.]